MNAKQACIHKSDSILLMITDTEDLNPIVTDFTSGDLPNIIIVTFHCEITVHAELLDYRKNLKKNVTPQDVTASERTYIACKGCPCYIFWVSL